MKATRRFTGWIRRPANRRCISFGFGIAQVANQADYLLFLLCLALLYRGFRELVRPMALFTLAYFLAIAVCAYSPGPAPLWAPLLAVTLVSAAIVYLGFENIFTTGTPRPAGVAAAAGGSSCPGCASWFDLQPALQFGGAHQSIAWLSFNAGSAMGEAIVLSILVWAVHFYFRFAETPKST